MPFVGLDPQLATELATEMRTAAAGADEQAAVTRQALALAELSSQVPVDLMELVEELTIAGDVVAASADMVASYENPRLEAVIARGLWTLALGAAAGQMGDDLTDIDAALQNFSMVYRLPEPTSITGLIAGIPTVRREVAAAVARLDTWLLPLLAEGRSPQDLDERDEEDLRLLLGTLHLTEEAMVRRERDGEYETNFSVGAGIELLANKVEADRRFFEYGALPDVASVVGKDYDDEYTTDLDWLPAALAGRTEVPARRHAMFEVVRLAVRRGFDGTKHEGWERDPRGMSTKDLANLAAGALGHLRGGSFLAGAVREGTELQIFSAAAIEAQLRFGAARGAVTEGVIANAAKRADTAFGIPRGQVVPPAVMAGPPVLLDKAAFKRAVAGEIGHLTDFPKPSANQLTAAYNWVHQAGSLAKQRERMTKVLLSWRSNALAGPAMMSASEQYRALAEIHSDLPKEASRALADPEDLNKVVEHLGDPGYHKIKLGSRYRLHLTNDNLGRTAQVQMEKKQSSLFGYVALGLGVGGVFFPPLAVVSGAMQVKQASDNDDWLGVAIAAVGTFAGAAAVGGAANVARAAYAVQGTMATARAIEAGDMVGAITAGAGAAAGGLGVSGFENTSRVVGAGGAAISAAEAVDDGDLLAALQHTASAVGQFGEFLGPGSEITETLDQVERFAQAARGIRDEDPVLVASALRGEITALASGAADFVARTVGDLEVFASNEPATMARIDGLAELPDDQLATEGTALEARLIPRTNRLTEVLERLETPIDSEERRALTRERDYLRHEITGLATDMQVIETARRMREFRAMTAPSPEPELSAPRLEAPPPVPVPAPRPLVPGPPIRELPGDLPMPSPPRPESGGSNLILPSPRRPDLPGELLIPSPPAHVTDGQGESRILPPAAPVDLLVPSSTDVLINGIGEMAGWAGRAGEAVRLDRKLYPYLDKVTNAVGDYVEELGKIMGPIGYGADVIKDLSEGYSLPGAYLRSAVKWAGEEIGGKIGTTVGGGAAVMAVAGLGLAGMTGVAVATTLIGAGFVAGHLGGGKIAEGFNDYVLDSLNIYTSPSSTPVYPIPPRPWVGRIPPRPTN